jgi:hypothetical protein
MVMKKLTKTEINAISRQLQRTILDSVELSEKELEKEIAHIEEKIAIFYHGDDYPILEIYCDPRTLLSIIEEHVIMPAVEERGLILQNATLKRAKNKFSLSHSEHSMYTLRKNVPEIESLSIMQLMDDITLAQIDSSDFKELQESVLKLYLK